VNQEINYKVGATTGKALYANGLEPWAILQRYEPKGKHWTKEFLAVVPVGTMFSITRSTNGRAVVFSICQVIGIQNRQRFYNEIGFVDGCYTIIQSFTGAAEIKKAIEWWSNRNPDCEPVAYARAIAIAIKNCATCAPSGYAPQSILIETDYRGRRSIKGLSAADLERLDELINPAETARSKSIERLSAAIKRHLVESSKN
jgi:hypothetical protein